MKRILILEDNEAVRGDIERVIAELGSNIECFSMAEVDKAYALIHNKHIDVFLVDIKLKPRESGDISGLEFVGKIRNIREYEFTPVIFITSLADPMLHAYYDLKCFAYIEKPFDYNELKKNIEKALSMSLLDDYHKVMYLRKDGVFYGIEKDRIVYIESCSRKIYIYTVDEKREFSYRTMHELQEMLGRNIYVRCSKHFLVNIRYIDNVDKSNMMISLCGGRYHIEAGRKYIDEIIRGW